MSLKTARDQGKESGLYGSIGGEVRSDRTETATARIVKPLIEKGRLGWSQILAIQKLQNREPYLRQGDRDLQEFPAGKNNRDSWTAEWFQRKKPGNPLES